MMRNKRKINVLQRRVAVLSSVRVCVCVYKNVRGYLVVDDRVARKCVWI